MKQGEIWHTDINPVKGSSQSGTRQVVIVSGDILNRYLNIVIVCPLTPHVKNYKGNVVLAPDEKNGLKAPAEILVFHICSLSKERLVRKTGEISEKQLDEIRKGLGEIMRY